MTVSVSVIPIPSFALTPVSVAPATWVSGAPNSGYGDTIYSSNKGKELIFTTGSDDSDSYRIDLTKSGNTVIVGKSSYAELNFSGTGTNTVVSASSWTEITTGARSNLTYVSSASFVDYPDWGGTNLFTLGDSTVNSLILNGTDNEVFTSSVGTKTNAIYSVNTGEDVYNNFELNGSSVDKVYTSGGDTILELGNGSDFAFLKGRSIQITGNNGNKTIYADSTGDDNSIVLTGTGSNQIYTSGGDFLIDPGKGSAFVHCGSGSEDILLHPNNGKYDTIYKFGESDNFRIDQSELQARFSLTNSTSWGDAAGLDSNYFVFGTAPTAAHAQFLFNEPTGTLSFSKGTGTGTPTLLAKVSLESGATFGLDNFAIYE